MANNSLNNERSNQDKLLQMQREASEARKEKIKILLVIAAIILAIAAFVVCIILFDAARPWMIATTIGVAYAALWNLLRAKTDFDYVPWYMFTNICLAIACIPLYCISTTTRAYAFGFALGVFISAIGLLVQCRGDMEKRQNKYHRYVYDFKYGDIEYFTTFFSTLAGGILFSIAFGLIFTGLARALIIGCGIALAYIVMSYFATALYYDSDVSTVFIVLDVVLGLTGIAFLFVNYNFTALSICLFAAVVLSSVIIAILRGESEWFWGVGAGVLLAGIAVLILLFAHVPVTDGFVIKDGVLISYGGTEEIVVIPEEVTEIGKKAFKHVGPRKNMKEVVLHDGITSIGARAFKNCDALKSVTIPGSVSVISDQAFGQCDNLESVTIEEGVTGIGVEAFISCVSLNSIDLPESLTEIRSYAFQSCISLKEIYLPVSLKTMVSGVFYGDNLTIHYAGTEDEWNNIEVPKGLYTKWKSGAKYEIVYNSKKPS